MNNNILMSRTKNSSQKNLLNKNKNDNLINKKGNNTINKDNNNTIPEIIIHIVNKVSTQLFMLIKKIK